MQVGTVEKEPFAVLVGQAAEELETGFPILHSVRDLALEGRGNLRRDSVLTGYFLHDLVEAFFFKRLVVRTIVHQQGWAVAEVDNLVGGALLFGQTDAGDVSFEKIFNVGTSASTIDVNFNFLAASVTAVGQHLITLLHRAAQLEGVVAVERLMDSEVGDRRNRPAVYLNVDVYFARHGVKGLSVYSISGRACFSERTRPIYGCFSDGTCRSDGVFQKDKRRLDESLQDDKQERTYMLPGIRGRYSSVGWATGIIPAKFSRTYRRA